MPVSEAENRADKMRSNASMPKSIEMFSEFKAVSSVMNEGRLYRFIPDEKRLGLIIYAELRRGP